jgi:hypothetical protein
MIQLTAWPSYISQIVTTSHALCIHDPECMISGKMTQKHVEPKCIQMQHPQGNFSRQCQSSHHMIVFPGKCVALIANQSVIEPTANLIKFSL